MEIKDMKVGDAVYCRLTGNECRRKTREELIQEWEIIKIGRKYITARRKGCSNTFDVQFEILKDYKQKTEYCVNYVLYSTRQDILNDFEINDLKQWFNEEFGTYGFPKYSLEKMRKAKEILIK